MAFRRWKLMFVNTTAWSEITLDWKCDVCNHENDEKATQCIICKTSKFLPDSLNINEDLMFRTAAKRRTVIMEDWQCDKCLTINDCRATECEVCKSTHDKRDQYKRRTLSREIAEDTVSETQSTQEEETCIIPEQNTWICPNCMIPYNKASHCDKCLLAHEHVVENFDNERRIILVGRTGCGKSATGNSILNTDVFFSDVSSSSLTRQCKRGKAERFGKILQVVDTPGLFDTGLDNETITKEIMKCVGITSPGPHAILMVIGIGRFTEEEKNTVQLLEKAFGTGIKKHMILVFTRKDDLDIRNKTIDDIVRNAPKHLRLILSACGNRFIAWNNNGSRQEKENQARRLYEMMERMITENGGRFFQSEIFSETELIINQRENEIRNRFERSGVRQQSKFVRQRSETAIDEKVVQMRKQTEDQCKSVAFDQYMQMTPVRMLTKTESGNGNEPNYMKMEYASDIFSDKIKSEEQQINLGSNNPTEDSEYLFRDTNIYEDYELREVVRMEVEEGSSSFFAKIWENVKRRMSKVFLSFLEKFKKKSYISDMNENFYEDM